MRHFVEDFTPIVHAWTDNGVFGGYMTIETVNSNSAAILADAHAIDRDNFQPNLLDETVIRGGTFHEMGSGELDDTDRSVEVTAQTAPSIPIPIPDAAEDPWGWDVTTSEGMMVGGVCVHLKQLNTGGNGVWLGLMLDGVLVARAPAVAGYMVGTPATDSPRATLTCSFAVPVGSGPHRVEPVLFLTARPGGSYDIIVGASAYHWRMVYR